MTARIPSEFTEKSDILEIVDRMSQVQDESSVKARRSMTHSLLEGFDSDRQDHGGTTTGRGRAILSAKEKALDKADAAVDWKESSKSIYAADLGLRKYYRPRERFGIAVLLAGGLVFLLIPTLLSVIRAISHF